MSTVFYAFRASNQDNLNEQIGIMKYLIGASKFPEIFKIDGVEIQVFSTCDGILYRVLENGYGLKNMMWKNREFFPPCNYDDRTDVPPEDESNKKIALAIDSQIEKKEYSIVTIVLPESPEPIRNYT